MGCCLQRAAERSKIVDMRREPSPIDLSRTLRRVRVPSFMLDRSGVITWVNDAAKAIFGGVEGRSMDSVIAPEDVARAREQLARKLAGVPVTDYEIDVFTRGGVRRRAEISSVRIENDACHAVFGVALPGPRQLKARPRARLTSRQSDVLGMLGEGLSTTQIALELHISPETVRNHVRGLLRALGVHSRVEAVALAHHEGLLD